MFEDFKVGDEVLCLDDGSACGWIFKGKTYFVEVVEGSQLKIIAEGYRPMWFNKEIFSKVCETAPHQGEQIIKQNTLDSHYNSTYKLTPEDIAAGSIKLDPYFVSSKWKLGSKDESGALWHIFKTIARFGEKNDKEREVRAMFTSLKRLAQILNITLEK